MTCLADVLIIAALFACCGAFIATHELFEVKKNEVFASGALNISGSMAKVKAYIMLSVTFNFAIVVLTIWTFWPVDGLFLYLLSYRVSNSNERVCVGHRVLRRRSDPTCGPPNFNEAG